MVIDRILIREHPLRQALTHDDDLLTAPAIGFVEIASGDQRNAERREKPWRNRPEACAWILFSISAYVSFRREFEPRAESARITPRNGGSECNAIYSWQFCDAPYRFFVKPNDLIRRFPIRNHGNVQCEYFVRIETRRRRLQCDQRLEQHAGAGQKYE